MLKQLTTISAALALAGLAQAGDGEKPYDLMIGDPAPALEVREWVQGAPVASFAAGQTYVVEFWATWCGPCRKAIPHMSELQEQYGDDVRFVGVSIWERISDEAPYAVPQFVEHMGEKMSYTVAADRTAEEQEARAAEAWMGAAGQNGIPTAFIVDGTGTVAWIGSPFEIDEPLAAIVAGDWDLHAEARAYSEKMELEALAEDVSRRVYEARKEKDLDGAVAMLTEAIESQPKLAKRFGMDKFALLIQAGHDEKAAAFGQHLLEEVYAEDPTYLNYLAWMLVDPALESRPDTALALRAAKTANELTEWKDPSILDTYARALFVSGDVEKALETQKKAVKLSVGTPYEKELGKRLEEYEAAHSGSGVGA